MEAVRTFGAQIVGSSADSHLLFQIATEIPNVVHQSEQFQVKRTRPEGDDFVQKFHVDVRDVSVFDDVHVGGVHVYVEGRYVFTSHAVVRLFGERTQR